MNTDWSRRVYISPSEINEILIPNFMHVKYFLETRYFLLSKQFRPHKALSRMVQEVPKPSASPPRRRKRKKPCVVSDSHCCLNTGCRCGRTHNLHRKSLPSASSIKWSMQKSTVGNAMRVAETDEGRMSRSEAEPGDGWRSRKDKTAEMRDIEGLRRGNVLYAKY